MTRYSKDGANPEQMGHVDNVRVANYASLPMANVGAPTPTDEMKIVVSVGKPNKDLYVALHNQNKKKHAVGCPSTCFYIALY